MFVQPVPATGALYQVSADGDSGHHSFWSRDGRELFYWGGGTMVSAPVTLGPGLTFGNAEPVPARFPSVMNALGPLEYDVTLDNRAFIWAKPIGFDDTAWEEEPNQLRVVLNWLDELKERVPVE